MSGFDWSLMTNLPSNLIAGTLSNVSQKAGEVANKLQWANMPTLKSYGLGDVRLTDFKAVTTSLYNGAAQNIVNKVGGPLANNISNSFGATQLSDIVGRNEPYEGDNKHAVKLRSTINSDDEIIFKVMPSIGESRSASYEEVSIAQHPGSILKYQTTTVRSWSIGGVKLVSRTVEEANENQRFVNILRSWLMPYYGAGTEKHEGKNMLGAPPDVLEFSAYGDKNIGPVPVVLENLSITWPNDVDYIHTSSNQPFPVIINIDIQLKESWSPREFSGFDLYAYKEGDMSAAYSPVSYQTSDTIGAKTEPTPLMNNTSAVALMGVTKQNVTLSEPKILDTASMMIKPPATPMEAINQMANQRGFDPKEYAIPGLDLGKKNPGGVSNGLKQSASSAPPQSTKRFLF